MAHLTAVHIIRGKISENDVHPWPTCQLSTQQSGDSVLGLLWEKLTVHGNDSLLAPKFWPLILEVSAAHTAAVLISHTARCDPRRF